MVEDFFSYRKQGFAKQTQLKCPERDREMSQEEEDTAQQQQPSSPSGVKRTLEPIAEEKEEEERLCKAPRTEKQQAKTTTEDDEDEDEDRAICMTSGLAPLIKAAAMADDGEKKGEKKDSPWLRAFDKVFAAQSPSLVRVCTEHQQCLWFGSPRMDDAVKKKVITRPTFGGCQHAIGNEKHQVRAALIRNPEKFSTLGNSRLKEVICVDAPVKFFVRNVPPDTRTVRIGFPLHAMPIAHHALPEGSYFLYLTEPVTVKGDRVKAKDLTNIDVYEALRKLLVHNSPELSAVLNELDKIAIRGARDNDPPGYGSEDLPPLLRLVNTLSYFGTWQIQDCGKDEVLITPTLIN